MPRRLVATPRRALLVAATGALLLLLASSVAVYSFWSGHRSSCDSRNATANLFHDVIVIASAPEPGTKPKPLTRAQRDRRDRIFDRIDRIRC